MLSGTVDDSVICSEDKYHSCLQYKRCGCLFMDKQLLSLKFSRLKVIYGKHEGGGGGGGGGGVEKFVVFDALQSTSLFDWMIVEVLNSEFYFFLLQYIIGDSYGLSMIFYLFSHH